MLEINKNLQEQIPASISGHPEAKRMSADSSSAAFDDKGAAGQHYGAGDTQSTGDKDRWVNLLRCLASFVNSKNTDSATEDRMAVLRDALAERGFNINEREFAQSHLGMELDKVGKKYQEVAAVIAEPDVDVASLKGCQQKLASVTANAADAMVRDIRNRSLTTKHIAAQTAAKLTAQAEVRDGNGDGEHDAPVFDGSIGYKDLWDKMAESIDNIKTSYVDRYATLMTSYAKLYEAYNTFVQKALADAVKAGKDGNTVNFNLSKLSDGYKLFDEERTKLEGELNKLVTIPKDQQKSWEAALAPAFKVDLKVVDGVEKVVITFNLDQYNGRAKYPDGHEVPGVTLVDYTLDISTASYQAWLASFNAVGSGLQSNMQSFAQRYSQANSTYDNLTKVLSGAISSLAESAKQVFRNLT